MSDIIGGNEDLLVEILLFLPAKSLVRLKLVSKGWLSLISSPFFCRRHTLHHPRSRPETQPSFILGVDDQRYTSQYFLCNPATATHKLSPFPLRLGSLSVGSILQSRNGLLLIRCGKPYDNRSPHFVFNPTTMQHRELSPLPRGISSAGLYLIFDPSLSPHYRVVCFTTPKEGALIHLYDPETHIWKLTDELDEVNLSFRNGIYFDRGMSFCSSLKFRDIPPNHYMESNGVLYMFLKERSKLLEVFEMSENAWRRKYRVCFNRVLGEGNYVTSIPLIGMFRGEREEDSLLLFSLNRKVMIYKFYDDVFEVLVDYGSLGFQKENNEWLDVKDAHHFIHTLAPL